MYNPSDKQKMRVYRAHADEKKKIHFKLCFYTFSQIKAMGKAKLCVYMYALCASKQIVAAYNARELRSCIARLREWHIDTTFWLVVPVCTTVLHLQAKFTEKLFTENSLVCVVCV